MRFRLTCGHTEAATDQMASSTEEFRGQHSGFVPMVASNLETIDESNRCSGTSERDLRNVRFRFASVSLASVAARAVASEGVRGELSDDAASDGLRWPWRHLKLDVRKVQLINWEARLPFFKDAEPEEAMTALNHVVSGTGARTLSQVCCHPLDTVKTRMQVKEPQKKLKKWRKKVSKKAIGIGPLDIDNWFFKGPGDLFRGVMGAVLGTAANAFLYFVCYEGAKRKLEKHLSPGWVHIASASIGTVAASIVRVPADTLKHRVQAYMHPNVFVAFSEVLASEGVGGLYKGYLPTIMRDVPEIVLQFAIYEKTREIIQTKMNVKKLSTPQHLGLGAFAGALTALATMPLDLVKTRQQCDGAGSIVKIIADVYAAGGYSGLLAGLGPRVLHVSCMSAFFFGFFEYGKMVLKPDRQASDKFLLPKIWNKKRDHIWKRQFVYTE